MTIGQGRAIKMTRTRKATGRQGLQIERVFTKDGDARDLMEWKRFDTRIDNTDGQAVFAQKGVEAPAGWSQVAVNLVANKYFRGRVGEPDRETSVGQLIDRVAGSIAAWGQEDGYFRTVEDAEAFRQELWYITAGQIAAFNSPVWFNVGIDAQPQSSACFIQSVEDTMESILDLAKSEGMLFKGGSGTGSNLSNLRGSEEGLSRGGTASGPVSFMRGFDAFAGVIKSGGRTRRAAKLVCLDVDHPDIVEFIDCKAEEERKAWALIDGGFDGSFNGVAYSSIMFQNANNSVRVGNDFMEACEEDGEWVTRRRTDGRPGRSHRARELLRKIAEATHVCGDPGMQYDTTINRWHTCKADGRIEASNPCCFPGDTPVLTSEGPVLIDELALMDGADLPMALTWDPDGECGTYREIVKVWEVGKASELVSVRTSAGRTLRCTPEHRFYTLDDEAVEARDLRPGTALRAFREMAPPMAAGRPADHEAAEDETVASVTRMSLDTPVGVYDLEVDETHRLVVSDGTPGGVVVSNSEYMFVNDSACNLASINLLRCTLEEPKGRRIGAFDTDVYAHVVRIMLTAMEILVGRSSYPTATIERNSHALRPLGLGYTNLGALLMSRGVPYDSDAGRDFAAALTSLLTAEAYHRSAEIAEHCTGAFPRWSENRESMLKVIAMHGEAADELAGRMEDADATRTDDETAEPDEAGLRGCPAGLAARGAERWRQALAAGRKHGYRNAQASVIAPAGTISFLMDADTTGIEPAAGLVTRKHLVGGGFLKMVNRTVEPTLRNLGYDEDARRAILEVIDKTGSAEGSGVQAADTAVFDCAMRSAEGTRVLSGESHVRMVAAVQPFVSGAISKTVNMPYDATAAEIEELYVNAWKWGLKSISIYRDGSKRTQPLSAGGTVQQNGKGTPKPQRRRLPDTREAVTHKFDIGGLMKGYITVGMFEDGSPGEIFLTIAKEGSTISGLADSFAQAISYGLQYGVPLEALVQKYSHARFEPSGITKNPKVRVAKSVVDYVFRWLASRFLDDDQQFEAGVNVERPAETGQPTAVREAAPGADGPSGELMSDAPACGSCGAIMTRTGTCYACAACGATYGCG